MRNHCTHPFYICFEQFKVVYNVDNYLFLFRRIKPFCDIFVIHIKTENYAYRATAY